MREILTFAVADSIIGTAIWCLLTMQFAQGIDIVVYAFLVNWVFNAIMVAIGAASLIIRSPLEKRS